MQNAENDALVDAVAAAIADGTPIDWAAVYRSARGEAERQLLEELERLPELVNGVTTPDTSRASASAARTDSSTNGRTWGALQLQECIGRGGFGQVFRAWDPRVGRDVALKLLNPAPHDPIPGESPSTVIREASLLARIRHPNVVTVFGAERIDGVDGIWMELLTGRTLADRLRTEGPVPERDAVEIGVEICRALVAVHRAGLIHRDLKAQNVICEPDGRVVLMDLGSGRAQQPESGCTTDLTGTPMYLAPELFTGASASEQSDLYSLGVLLYHVVSCRFPVPAETLSELAASHAAGRSVPLERVAPEVTNPFREVVQRAIDPNPGRRFVSASEMEAALVAASQPSRQVPFITLAGLLMAIVLVLAVSTHSADMRAPRDGPEHPILIGTFENRTGQPDLDGAVEALLKHDLGSKPGLVIAGEERIHDTLTLMKRPPGQNVDGATAREVALRDGAIRTYVTGSIEPRGRGYVIAAHVGALDGTERVIMQVVPAPEALARAVARLSDTLRHRLGLATRKDIPRERPEQVTTPSLPALRLYSAALRASARNDNDTALELARQATLEDPAFASAYTWIAWCEMVLGRREEARASSRRALELSNGASEAERLFALALSRDLDGQRVEARAAYRALVDIRPDHYWAVTRLIVLSGPLTDAAVTLIKQAADLRPTNYEANRTAAFALQSSGDVARASLYVQRARVIAGPPDTRDDGWLALFPAFELWMAGRVDEAARLVDASVSGPQTSTSVLQSAAEFNLALGRLQAAERAVARLPVTAARIRLPSALATWLRSGDVPSPAAPPPQGRLAQVPTWVWLLVRAGKLEEARALVNIERAVQGQNTPGLAAMEGMLLHATGDSARAAPALDSAWRGMAPGLFFTFATADEAAQAFRRVGDVAQACEILDDATRDRGRGYGAGASMLGWLNARVQLLECYSTLGRSAAAEEIATELRPLLALADADFEPLARFRRASH